MTGAGETKCGCSWAPLGSTGGKYMTARDGTCPLHGDGTGWWERQKAHARALGARIHVQ